MSIRLRLALWYTAFLAIMFAVFAPAVYSAFERELVNEVDRWLSPVADHVLRSASDNAHALESLRGTTSGDLSPSQLFNALAAYQDLDLERFSSPGVSIEILDASGSVIARSPNLNGQSIPIPAGAFATPGSGTANSFTLDWGGARYRAYLAPIPGDSAPRGFVLVVRNLGEVDRALARIRIWLVAGLLAGLGFAAGIGWLIARNALRPVDEITSTARSIALSRDFGHRLKVGPLHDEVGELAETFNEMLASLDVAYVAQRRFVSDASHELRSPLTSIRSNIDILRRALDAPREDREEMLADVASEVDRLSRLTSDLLLLARADAGHRIEMAPLSLDELLSDVHRQMSVQARDVKLDLGTTEEIVVVGNQVWLKQLLLILLDNALKYTPSGGTVRLSVERDGANAVVKVSDSGIGIAEEDLPRIFERFYRADKARARDEGGVGLGLAIARWIAEEHQGHLSAESEPGRGTTFTLTLPAGS